MCESSVCSCSKHRPCVCLVLVSLVVSVFSQCFVIFLRVRVSVGANACACNFCGLCLAGPISGNTTVTVTGNHFAPPITCHFGSATVIGTFISQYFVICVTPPHTTGAVDVKVSINLRYEGSVFSLSLSLSRTDTTLTLPHRYTHRHRHAHHLLSHYISHA
jgi:hypothetical protein